MDSVIKEMIDSFQGQALNFCVVLRQIENKNVTGAGLDISMMADKNEKYKKGVVISIGTGCPKKNFRIFGIEIPFIKLNNINKGDTVLYDTYKSSMVTLETIEYQVMFYADLVHVL